VVAGILQYCFRLQQVMTHGVRCGLCFRVHTVFGAVCVSRAHGVRCGLCFRCTRCSVWFTKMFRSCGSAAGRNNVERCVPEGLLRRSEAAAAQQGRKNVELCVPEGLLRCSEAAAAQQRRNNVERERNSNGSLLQTQTRANYFRDTNARKLF
jgi:hypothetical protein